MERSQNVNKDFVLQTCQLGLVFTLTDEEIVNVFTQKQSAEIFSNLQRIRLELEEVA